MSGSKINNHQIKVYMKLTQEGKTKKTAAAIAGFSERSAYNIEKRGFKVANKKRTYRTRQDPFDDVLESVIVPLLEKHPGINSTTIIEKLQSEYPDKFSNEQLRTLQRRVSTWNATKGPEKDVIFQQKHNPGEVGISDFTSCNKLGITLNGERFDHLLYQFRLTCSTYGDATAIEGGESLVALSGGLQKALWKIGGVPSNNRTDSLSAAYKNRSKEEKEDITKRYEELCEHYGMRPTRNNRGIAHENGSIESFNGHFKNQIKQALMLRGSKDFDSMEEYQKFIDQVMDKHNRKIKKRFEEEKPFLKPLPERKTCDFEEIKAKVATTGMINVKSVLYSVPSRSIGRILKVHLYYDRLECFDGMYKIITLPRVRRKNGVDRHCINYKHLAKPLLKKPQAFRNYIYKDYMFPTQVFREMWNEMDKAYDERKACREYVKILYEASIDNRERKVRKYIKKCLKQRKIPTSEGVKKLFKQKTADRLFIRIRHEDMSDYNALLQLGDNT